MMRKPNYIGDWIIAIALSLPCGFDNVFVREAWEDLVAFITHSLLVAAIFISSLLD